LHLDGVGVRSYTGDIHEMGYMMCVTALIRIGHQIHSLSGCV